MSGEEISPHYVDDADDENNNSVDTDEQSFNNLKENEALKRGSSQKMRPHSQDRLQLTQQSTFPIHERQISSDKTLKSPNHNHQLQITVNNINKHSSSDSADESNGNVRIQTTDFERLTKQASVLRHFLLSERKQRLSFINKVADFTRNHESLKKANMELEVQLSKFELENGKLKEKINELERINAINTKKPSNSLSFTLTSLFNKSSPSNDNSEGSNSSIVSNNIGNNIISSSSSSTSPQPHHHQSSGDLFSSSPSNPGNRVLNKKLSRKELEDYCIKLVREVEFYVEKLTTLEENHNCSEKVLQDIKSLYKLTNEQLQNSNSTLSEFEIKMKILDDENRKLTNSLFQANEDKRKEVIETKLWQQRHQESLKNIEELQKKMDGKDKEIEDLKIALDKKTFDADSMAQKLIQLKEQMDLIHLVMKKFRVKKINKLLPKSDGEIILQKNPSTGAFMLDMVTASGTKHDLRLLQDISDIFADETNPLLFTIEMNSGQQLMFESEDRMEAIASIKEFIRLQLQNSPWWTKNTNREPKK